MDNTREYLNTAVIDTNSIGDNIIILAPTVVGNYIAIDFISFKSSDTNTITFKSGTNAESGPIPLDKGESLTWENTIKNSSGVITCNPNETFIIHLSNADQIGGMIRYREVGF